MNPINLLINNINGQRANNVNQLKDNRIEDKCVQYFVLYKSINRNGEIEELMLMLVLLIRLHSSNDNSWISKYIIILILNKR